MTTEEYKEDEEIFDTANDVLMMVENLGKNQTVTYAVSPEKGSEWHEFGCNHWEEGQTYTVGKHAGKLLQNLTICECGYGILRELRLDVLAEPAPTNQVIYDSRIEGIIHDPLQKKQFLRKSSVQQKAFYHRYQTAQKDHLEKYGDFLPPVSLAKLKAVEDEPVQEEA